ncbi:MAG: hypothetical protein ACO2Y5_08520 [Nitrosopumilaceae archaeon]
MLKTIFIGVIVVAGIALAVLVGLNLYFSIVEGDSQSPEPIITIKNKTEIVCPQGFEPVNGICPDKPVVEKPES